MKRIIDTKELVDKQVISEEVANNISDYYQNKKNVTTNTSLPLIIVAIFFVVTGCIFLIGNKWTSIPLAFQIIIALIPLTLSTTGCYHVYKHKFESRAWKEGVCLFQCLSMCVTFHIINGIYNVELSSGFVFILLAVLSYPFVFLFQSVISSSFIIAIACCSIFEFSGFTCMLLPIVGIIDLYFLYDFYYKKHNTFLCKFRTAVLPILILFSWILYYLIIDILFDGKWDDFIFIISAIIISCWTFSLHTWIRDSQNIASSATMLKICSFVAIYVSISIMLFELDKFKKIEWLSALNIIIFLSSFLVFFVSLYCKKKRGKSIESDEWVPLLSIPVIVGTFTMTDNIRLICVAILLVLYLGYLTYTGVKSSDLVKLNTVLPGWYAYMVQTMMVSDLSFVTIGIFSIVWGVILFFLNYYLHAKRKKCQK